MGVKDGASPGEKEILTDLPVTGIRVKRDCSSNNVDSNRKALFVNFRGQLVEIEKMFMTEDNDTAIGPTGLRLGKPTALPIDILPSGTISFKN